MRRRRTGVTDLFPVPSLYRSGPGRDFPRTAPVAHRGAARRDLPGGDKGEKDPSDLYIKLGEDAAHDALHELLKTAQPVDLANLEAALPVAIEGAPKNLRQPPGWFYSDHGISRIDEKTEHSEIARAFRKIEGLNLKMKNKKVIAVGDAKSHSPQKNSWLALRAAREKTAPEGGNFRSFPKMVQFYTFARTEFQRSCE